MKHVSINYSLLNIKSGIKINGLVLHGLGTRGDFVVSRVGGGQRFSIGGSSLRSHISKHESAIEGKLPADDEARAIVSAAHNVAASRVPTATMCCLRTGYDPTPELVRRLRGAGAYCDKDFAPVVQANITPVSAPPLAKPEIQARLATPATRSLEAELEQLKSDLEKPLRDKIVHMRALLDTAERSIASAVGDTLRKALNMPTSGAEPAWDVAMRQLREAAEARANV